MALSVFQDPQGVEWPLGCITVATPGTPLNIMSLVDANNNNAPWAQTSPWSRGPEYTPRCHKIFLQGFHAAANNNGMVINAGNVYIMRALGPGNQNAGGPGNRSDSGAMVQVLTPGGGVTLPANELDLATISPYRYTIDADVAGDGALVVAIGSSR
jgi:hypothetical protein